MPRQYLTLLEQAADALQYLTLHPDGLAVATLAELLGLDEPDTRQNLAAYHESQFTDGDFGSASPLLLADDIPPAGVVRDDWFAEHEAPDLASAVWVALDRDLSSRDVFGVMLDVPQIVDLLDCADHLLAQEPGNDALRTAAATLQVTWVPHMTRASRQFGENAQLPLIRRAIVECRRLRLHYSREWEPGAAVRVVEPYELKQTRLGYELDAGPPDANGRIRTFLVRNMTELEVLDGTFTPPADMRALIDRNRETLTVRVVVPKTQRAAYESLALDVRRVGGLADDDEDWELEVTLQQPFEDRLALFLMRAGPDAFLAERIELMNRADFARYDGALARKARALLRHHGL